MQQLFYGTHVGKQSVSSKTVNDKPKRKKKLKGVPLLTSTVPDKARGPDDGHMVGYARVSTHDQSLQRQVDELVKYGVHAHDIFSDKASGKDMKREGWEACWMDLQEGDLLVVHSLDRLGRNLEEVIRIEREIRERGATLKVLVQDINTSTPAGRLIFHILMTVAQFEREWSLERTMHGLRKARERGVMGGAMAKFTDAQIENAVNKVGGPQAANAWLRAADMVGCSKPTIMRRYAAIQARKEQEAISDANT
jgi:DNA invertase Pin-like site-specific DNA recombinase